MRGAQGPDRVWLRVLGHPAVEVDGVAVPLSTLQRRLLAVLASRAPHIVGVDRLVEALWGAQPPRSGPNRIQALVSDIRRRLATHRIDIPVIETVAPGYRWRPDLATLDTDVFGHRVNRARAAVDGGRLEEAAQAYGTALALWRGTPFEDADAAFDEALAAVAAGLVELKATVLEEHFEVKLRLGRHAAAMPELTTAVAADPLRERLRGQLMLALYRSGRIADALKVFRAGYQKSIDELGTEPTEELQRLHRAILAGEPSLSEPAPPVRPVTGPAQLPPPPTPFLGRVNEIRSLQKAFAERESSAIVVTAIEGAGGVGKTALALHWAHEMLDAFPDGQLYVNLQGYSTGTAVKPLQALTLLLLALGVGPAAIPDETPAAEAMFRGKVAGKRMLLLLDNAAHPDQVRPLLPAEMGSIALITTRDRFTGLVASHGARRVLVDVLPPDEAVALLGRIIGLERVAAEEPAAATIADACSRLPLALRIVAANLSDAPGRPLAEAAAELQSDDRLNALGVEGDTAMSVRVVLGQSYAKLGPPARLVLALLGLVPGTDVTLAAVVAMAGTGEAATREAVEELVQAHLATPLGDGRYSWHDVVVAFARERAREDLGDARCAEAVDALIEHYLSRIGSAARLMYPQVLRLPATVGPGPCADGDGRTDFTDRQQALDWLEAERANLVAAVRHAQAQGPGPGAWLIADGLNGFFWTRRYMADWLFTGELGLRAAQAAGDVRAQAAMHICLGQAKRMAGRYAPAGEHFEAAIGLAAASGWDAGQARAHNNRAIVLAELGRLAQAVAALNHALQVERRTENLAGEAVCRMNLGSLRIRMGLFREAHGDMVAAKALYLRVASPGGHAMATANLGLACHQLGRYGEAAGHIADAIAEAESIGDRYCRAMATMFRANVHRETGKGDAALADLAEAVAITEDAQDPSTRCHLLVHESSVRCDLEDYGRARKALQEAQALSESLNDDYGHAEVLVSRAQLDVRTAPPHQAAASAGEAERYTAERGYRYLNGYARYALAAAHKAAGETREARHWAQRALATFRICGHRRGEAWALALLAEVRVEPELARRLRDAAERIEQSMR